MKQIMPLRDETQKRGLAIQEASKRKASPQEACKIIQDFVKAEQRFISFLSSKQAECQIPPDIPKQLKANHAKSAELQKKVCTAANTPQGPAGPTLSDVIGSPVVPEAPAKRTGGSTFDTLSGNVLAR